MTHSVSLLWENFGQPGNLGMEAEVVALQSLSLSTHETRTVKLKHQVKTPDTDLEVITYDHLTIWLIYSVLHRLKYHVKHLNTEVYNSTMHPHHSPKTPMETTGYSYNELK